MHVLPLDKYTAQRPVKFHRLYLTDRYRFWKFFQCAPSYSRNLNVFMLCYENYHRKIAEIRPRTTLLTKLIRWPSVFRIVGQSGNFFHRRAIAEATFYSTQLSPIDYHHHPILTEAGKNRRENLVIKFWGRNFYWPVNAEVWPPFLPECL